MNATQKTLYKVENYGKLTFILASIVSLPIRNYERLILGIGMIVCILGINRQMKGIRFTKKFFAQALTKDFGAGLIYLVLMLGVTKPLRIFCLPTSLYFALGFAEFVNIENVYIFQKISKINNLLVYLRTNSNELKRAKMLMEFFLFFYSIIILLFAGGNIFTPVSIFNFIRIRMLNQGYKQVLSSFMNNIHGKLVGSSNPLFKIMGKVWGYFCLLYTSPSPRDLSTSRMPSSA